MARTVDLEHRAALAETIAANFVATGTARSSLRELAEAAGTSARMLVHHFSSRDELVATALEIAREQQLAAARRAIQPRSDALDALRDVWTWFRRADTLRYFALFTEVAATERVQPAADRKFAARLGTDWLPMFEAVFLADERFASRAPELARLVVGVLRGFALDRDGARGAAQARSFDALLELLAGSRVEGAP